MGHNPSCCKTQAVTISQTSISTCNNNNNIAIEENSKSNRQKYTTFDDSQSDQIKILGEQNKLEMLSRNHHQLIKLQPVLCEKSQIKHTSMSSLKPGRSTSLGHTNKLKSSLRLSGKYSISPQKPTSYSELNNPLTTSLQSLPISQSNINKSFQRKSKQLPSKKNKQMIFVEVNEKFKDGSSYVGQKVNQKRHGYGCYTFGNQSVYKGNWVNNIMQGKGLLFYGNGRLAYEGEFKNNQFHGYGFLNNLVQEKPSSGSSTNNNTNNNVIQYAAPDQAILPGKSHQNIGFSDKYYEDLDKIGKLWTRYEGEFKADQKHGRGRLYFINGDVLIADFFEGKVTGNAVLHRSADNSIVQGYWRNNKLIRVSV